MVTSVALSADGALLLTASGDTTAKLWDIASGTPLHVFGHGAYVCAAAFSPDGKSILTASHDGSARLWDVSSRTAPWQPHDPRK
jgi:WD40 repeat protein